MADQRTVESFPGPEEFRAWLLDHHDRSAGIWLKCAKKGSSVTTVTHDEALEVAIAFGWIDGQVRRLDDDFYLQGYTKRRARSPWSTRNRRIAERLHADGLMQPSGRAEVERAEVDGRWGRAYDGQRDARMHPDFLAALDRNQAAKDFYATLNSHNKYAIYYRVQDAKRPETRRRRIEKFVDMLARGERFH
ncbi:MAG: YdeI/OmpD-associated family protein [Streptosporangiales bacterium]